MVPPSNEYEDTSPPLPLRSEVSLSELEENYVRRAQAVGEPYGGTALDFQVIGGPDNGSPQRSRVAASHKIFSTPLAVAATTPRPLQQASMQASSSSLANVQPSGKTRKRKRGKKSSESRPRGGQDLKEANGNTREARKMRLQRRKTKVVLLEGFSVVEDALASSTGWHGRHPPLKDRAAVDAAWESGAIRVALAHFYPVRCNLASKRATIVVDNSQRTFVYRTTPQEWLAQMAPELHEAIDELLSSTLSNPAVRTECLLGSRGPHYPLIIGHCRQYTKTPSKTQWHNDHQIAVDVFLAKEVVHRLILWAASLVELAFPGVAKRFKECADWHEKKHGFKPLFGLFFNFCINGLFPGQKRVHCKPHADHKNIVGVCMVIVYILLGSNFDHTRRTWLVLWEAGILLELPPWVAIAYPSSLFYHFNVDIHDIEFVTTSAQITMPNRQNSKPILPGDDEGRGSMVFFNQASMYQTSETGFPTLTQAKKKGHAGVVDYPTTANEAFKKLGRVLTKNDSQ